MNKKTSAETDMAHLLDTFGYHMRCLATNEPGKFGLGLTAGGVSVNVSVEIHMRKNPDASGINMIWDQVYIDGKWCGNRAGGCREYAERCAPVFLASAQQSILAAAQTVTAQATPRDDFEAFNNMMAAAHRNTNNK